MDAKVPSGNGQGRIKVIKNEAATGRLGRCEVVELNRADCRPRAWLQGQLEIVVYLIL